MSFRLSHSLFYLLFCLASPLALLTFCGDDNVNEAQDDLNTGTTPPSSPTTPQTTTTEPKYRFEPAAITAGLPFSFELVWKGKPYLLSLDSDSCGTDTLLLHGMWPNTQSATTHIEGQDTTKLTNLAIINTSGSPTIPTDCKLKTTVDYGKASEESTLIALNTKAGAITLSNVEMLEKNVTLDATGVPPNKSSAVVVGKKHTSRVDGVSHTEYSFVAVSCVSRLKAVQNDRVASDIKLCVPAIPPIKEIAAFAASDYLVSVVSYRGFDISNVEFFHISAIKASKN